MNSLSIPLAGLDAAVTRLNRAADRIDETPVREQGGGAAWASGTTGGPPPQNPPTGIRESEGSLAGAIVDMKIAEHAYKANITALKTMAETQDSLLEITL